MPTLEGVKKAFVKAHESGDRDSAAMFARVIRDEEKRRKSDPIYNDEVHQKTNPELPGYVSDEIPWLAKQEEGPGLVDKALDVAGGVVETPVTMATGMAGQAVGLGNMIHEGVKAYFQGASQGRGFDAGMQAVDEYFTGDGGRRTEEAFQRGAEAVTYQPRTETGQAIIETIGEATESLPPVLGGSVSQALGAGQLAKGAAPIVRSRVVEPAARIASDAATKTGEVATKTFKSIQEAKENRKKRKALKENQGPLARSFKDAGAASTPDALRRTEVARGVNVHLTKARASGDDELIKWENEIYRDANHGEQIRELAKANNRAIEQTFDQMMEDTGYRHVGDYEKGEAFSSALWNQYARERKRKNDAYAAAEEAGHMDDLIELTNLESWINDNLAGSRADLVSDAVAYGIEKGIFVPVDVEIRPGVTARRVMADEVTIKESEDFAKYIYRKANSSNENERRQRDEMRRAISANQEGVGGELYRNARALNRKLMADFKDDHLVRDLLVNPARTENRKIAIENIMNQIILSPRASVDRVVHILDLLGRSEEGQEVIKEIRAATINKIQQATYANATWTGLGEDAKASFARIKNQVNSLDRTRKLELLIGEREAQRIRDIRDTVKWLNAQPEGTFNNSETAYTLKGMVAKSIKSKVPFVDIIHAAEEAIENRKTRAKVIDNLRGFE